MTTLRGHSRPVQIPFLSYVLDHTYATCATGHCWPCWGDCKGGTILKTGTGSSAQAECISQPASQAGIEYGVTGLCHQTSNRILWPANVSVADAAGYSATEYFFGAYGNDPDDWLAHLGSCRAVSGESPQCDGTVAPDSEPAGSKDQALLSWIQGIYTRLASGAPSGLLPSPDVELLRRLLERRLEHVLGERGRQFFERLARIQERAIEAKQPLDARLREGAIRGREFAEGANQIINRTLAEIADVIGPVDYAAYFRLPPNVAIIFVRPDICEEVYG